MNSDDDRIDDKVAAENRAWLKNYFAPMNQARKEAAANAEAARPDNISDEELERLNIRVAAVSRNGRQIETHRDRVLITEEQKRDLQRRTDIPALLQQFADTQTQNRIAMQNRALYRVLRYKSAQKTKQA